MKKSPPEWNFVHTEAVQQLKKLEEKLPPLQIPRLGTWILQIDASDEYWAATYKHILGLGTQTWHEAHEHMEDSTKHVENIDPSAQACKSTDLNI